MGVRCKSIRTENSNMFVVRCSNVRKYGKEQLTQRHGEFSNMFAISPESGAFSPLRRFERTGPFLGGVRMFVRRNAFDANTSATWKIVHWRRSFAAFNSRHQ